MKKLFLSLFVLALLGGCTLAVHRVQNPMEARLVTSDLEQFWKAYDQALISTNPTEVFQKQYFDRGSSGLKEFFDKRIGNVEKFSDVVMSRRKYMESIRESTMALTKESSVTQKIRQGFARIKQLYPQANFINTYFLIGRFNSGGTVSEGAIMIGTEFYGKSTNSSLDELTPWEQANTQDSSKLPFMVIHELIHTLQARHARTTLLDQVLAEGAADFIASLASGEKPHGSYFEYGLQFEKVLWEEFRPHINSRDFSSWLYQGNRANGRPADLGYFIGYRIAEAYYNQAADQQKAISDILHLKDSVAFLEQSGYRGQ